jgi:cytochrome c-type protein NapC
MTRKHTWYWLAASLLILVPVLMIGGWTLTEGAIQATSDREFCTTCHSMEPFALAYDQDVHGGQNPGGVAANCVDCHLPHDSPGGYLVAKIQTGIHDGFAELMSVFREPDWIGNLNKRAEYVYDSGCLKCHSKLESAPEDNPTTAMAHQTYFQGDANLLCVTCHAHVGHKDLLTHLSGGDAAAATTGNFLLASAYADPAAPGQGGDPLVGRQVYDAKMCNLCHTIGGVSGPMAELGGSLDDVGLRRNEEWLRLYFTDPKAAIPTATMPKANLTEQELADLVAYLATLR